MEVVCTYFKEIIKKKSGRAVSVDTVVGLRWNVYIFRYLQSFVKIYFSIQKYI